MVQQFLFPSLEFRLRKYTSADQASLTELLRSAKLIGLGVLSGGRTAEELLIRAEAYLQRLPDNDLYYLILQGNAPRGFAVISAHRLTPYLELAFIHADSTLEESRIRYLLLEEVRRYNPALRIL